MSLLWLFLGLLFLIAAYLVSNYNFFQTSLTRIKASIQEIGNQLKRQADLIPNLEASAKGYLSHEKGILESLAEARKQIASAAKSDNPSVQAGAAGALSDLLPRLSVIVESNPELKANETIINLMGELRDTADKIMYARRTLIDLTADYNIKVVTFPSNIVANLFSFKEQAGLKLADMENALSVSPKDVESPKINL
ncbi:MAG: Divalent cation transporter [Microgenomates group bacterium GW2011_GWF2_47_9]|nr:MAG: Divalent cation transporter [Microgenomates group bacterium GW2011_GWF2_47_9]